MRICHTQDEDFPTQGSGVQFPSARSNGGGPLLRAIWELRLNDRPFNRPIRRARTRAPQRIISESRELNIRRSSGVTTTKTGTNVPEKICQHLLGNREV